MLQKNYLADITTQANTAVAASQSALESQVSAENDASVAETSADSALASAIRAEAAAERAEAVSGIDIATTEKVGIVKPDGSTITIDEDGTIHSNSTSTITVDTELSKDSENPIANKAVANEIESLNTSINNITNGTTQVGNAKTLDGHGAEYFAPKTDYLPLTGGTVYGDVMLYTNDTNLRTLNIGNKARMLGFRVDGNGDANFYDYTLDKTVFVMAANGTTTFNGIANGNLPLTGGMLANYDSTPLVIKNLNGTSIYQRFDNKEIVCGYLGFAGRDNPVYIMADSSTTHNLLHTGNKPTGSYTGNGVDALRSIAVGGLANGVIVYGPGRMAVVTFGGYVGHQSGNVKAHTTTYFDEPNEALCVGSNDTNFLNENGVQYKYFAF